MLTSCFSCHGLLVTAGLLLVSLAAETSANSTTVDQCLVPPVCRKGFFLPIWEPQNVSTGDKAARAIVYFLALAYMFLGVSIIADRFMSAIEVITSKEREVVVKKPNGETFTVSVRIWNETVSNLTLMALGSSAPEILLSIIEIIGNGFEAGDLGPGTIVGSAAFNLFIIIALCVYVIPNDEVRRVKHLHVFFVTATWSIFAYIWLYLIIAQISRGVIEIWEGVLTFVFFPATVLTAWIADRQIYTKFLPAQYRKTKRAGGVVIQSEGLTDLEMDDRGNHVGGDAEALYMDTSDELRMFETHRKEYIEIVRELRKKHPNYTTQQLEELAQVEAMNRGPKSRAFYRIQATRKLTGGGNVIKKKVAGDARKDTVLTEDPEKEYVTQVYFEPAHYTVMENVGSFDVSVCRSGGDLNNTVYVDYETADGSANVDTDYELAKGTLVFGPGEMTKTFPVSIIDDDIFEEDEHFYVNLTNLRLGDPNGMFVADDNANSVCLGTPAVATVMILDDDHAGIFHFEEAEHEVGESVGVMHLKVMRSSGARGTVSVPFKTIEGSAKFGRHFEKTSGDVEFSNDEHEKFVQIGIVDDREYTKDIQFYVELGEPHLIRTASGVQVHQQPSHEDPNNMNEEERIAEMGKPRMGDVNRVAIHIRESDEFRNTVDKLLTNQSSQAVGTSSWQEQFIEAITVSSGADDDNDDNDEEGSEKDGGEDKLPSLGDYVMHYLSLFWKVLFAFVPPTDYCGGWICFVVSILMIGILTAFIGDLASHFGCTVGLRDTVTAISFVALGTSVPDTFASKVAAIGDRHADSSIGNVTGSNAVNVFLGIGIAWTMAAIKHAIYGTEFRVDPGSLAFSVTIYCVFAVLAIALMVLRRNKKVGGELGGPVRYKLPSSVFLVLLWVTYVLLSAMVSYCYIDGF